MANTAEDFMDGITAETQINAAVQDMMAGSESTDAIQGPPRKRARRGQAGTSGPSEGSEAAPTAGLTMRDTKNLEMCIQLVPSSQLYKNKCNFMSHLIEDCVFTISKGQREADADLGIEAAEAGIMNVKSLDSAQAVAIDCTLSVPVGNLYLKQSTKMLIPVKVKAIMHVLERVTPRDMLEIFIKTGDDKLTFEWFSHVSQRGRNRASVSILSLSEDYEPPKVKPTRIIYTVPFELEKLREIAEGSTRAGADSVHVEIFKVPASLLQNETNTGGTEGTEGVVLRISYDGDLAETSEMFAFITSPGMKVAQPALEASYTNNAIVKALANPNIDLSFASKYLSNIVKGMPKHPVNVSFNHEDSHDPLDFLILEQKTTSDRGQSVLTLLSLLAPQISQN